jgi:two-component system chemotaxis sensor kinase CheA
LEFYGLNFGANYWNKFEIRLGAALIEEGVFSQYPKFEIPLIEGKIKPFDSWFEESKDDSGPKLELRFSLEKNVFDILILQTDHFTYALQVDGILDSEEIVLKRLNPCFNYKGIYSGATFMGDGSIGLILDVKNIALASGIKLESIKSEMSKIKLNQNLVKENNSLINYLLFKIESKSIYGIPLKNVFRLEEIDKSKIQYLGSNKVITYRDGIMPIYSMENILNLSKKSDLIDEQRDQLSVIVLENIEGYMGFEVPKIIDIVLGENDIKKEVRDRIGVLGNAFIQDHTVTILDMPSVLMKTINLNN